MKGVFEYIMDRFIGNTTSPFYSAFGGRASDALLSKGLQLNDFFVQDYNNKEMGLLLAEFVPPEIDGLPIRIPDFSNADGAVLMSKGSFASHQTDAPCVRVSNYEAEQLACLAERDDPVPLEPYHCEDAYWQAYNDILSYAERIETIPMKSTSHRWPDPPKYCVWDCGNYWDGYDTPAHIGLTDNVRDNMFLPQLEIWKKQCINDAGLKKFCVRNRNTTQFAMAAQEANRKGFTQEVCGEYIDETSKLLKDNPWLAGVIIAGAILALPFSGGASLTALGAGTVAIVGAAAGSAGATIQIGDAFEQLNGFRHDNISTHIQSIFTDETARHVTDREYRYVACFIFRKAFRRCPDHCTKMIAGAC